MNTGFKDLDDVIKINGGKLIVLASRPSMGKSTFALNILNNIATKQNLPVLCFNLEASKEQIINKLISNNSMVEYSEIQKEKIDNNIWKKIQKGISIFSDAEIYIEDTPGISIEEICEKSRKMKKEKDIQFVLIDYIHLISYDKRECLSRDQEISQISHTLKLLAEELNIPILVVSQLSRGPEERKNHKPILEDFHASRDLVQVADIVMFLYRDDYYNEDSEKKNIAEIIVIKNKDGICDQTVEIATLLEYCKFASLARKY